MNASAFALKNCSNAASISLAFRTLRAMVSTPSFVAPASASACSILALGLVGFISSAMRDTFGAICRRSSNSLCAKHILIEENAGHVRAGAVYTFDQPKADGITADCEDHRHRAARTLRGACRSNISGGGNSSDAHSYKLSRKSRQCIIVPAGPPFLDTDISALKESGFRQTLPKRVSIEAIGIGRGAVQETYQRHLLLRQCCKGERARRTTQNAEKIPPSHALP